MARVYLGSFEGPLRIAPGQACYQASCQCFSGKQQPVPRDDFAGIPSATEKEKEKDAEISNNLDKERYI